MPRQTALTEIIAWSHNEKSALNLNIDPSLNLKTMCYNTINCDIATVNQKCCDDADLS